ncbi:o-succinylbenzoate synthase [Odoribacter sp. AF15-53]|uniref:o-succinylbenzoate synthase n=1 Tax=Odoribacter sp. AF15-53 TaxID=2292236 RepID=UPI000E494D8A|nr:o-succinylbenzoate synthase [Odoribacter sp. AF15-53]RHR79746.1 o-succinylbenzoate synthase [Odoribacter sp. AF15-53]
MLQATYSKYLLKFKQPAGTSRGILTEKETWFIKIWDSEQPEIYGLGECALFRGLSADDVPGYEEKLKEICQHINTFSPQELQTWSSIRFGIETALADLSNKGKRIIYPSPFPEGTTTIEINGLIWMGDKETMRQRIIEKLEAGFHCIKLKIGAIDFQAELDLLHAIRSSFSKETIELRVDANGAFHPDEAPRKLEQLSRYGLHSIEQPIRQGQWEKMSKLCRNTPVPIALDEELIGINDTREKIDMLETIHPQYIILKPALVGGFLGSEEWIRLADKHQIGWWITSALESNVGLNAIAQWTALLNVQIPQGLGTGQLYTNNIPSPLEQSGSVLCYNPGKNWDLTSLKF